jgi:hypothetical protein
MFSDAAFSDFMKRFSAEDLSGGVRPEVKSVNELGSGGIQANPVKPTVSTADMSSDIKGKVLANSTKEGGGLDGVVSKINGLAGGLAGNLGGAAAHTDRYDYDPEFQSKMMAYEGVKDVAAEALGPYGQAARAVEKVTKGVATAIGGEEAGDIAGQMVDPLGTQLELLNNEEATDVEKVLGMVPIAGGIAASNARNRFKFKKGKEENAKEHELGKRKREQEYRMAEGLESMENLKALRKKQLGLI